jgi:hypothetical protein
MPSRSSRRPSLLHDLPSLCLPCVVTTDLWPSHLTLRPSYTGGPLRSKGLIRQGGDEPLCAIQSADRTPFTRVSFASAMLSKEAVDDVFFISSCITTQKPHYESLLIWRSSTGLIVDDITSWLPINFPQPFIESLLIDADTSSSRPSRGSPRTILAHRPQIHRAQEHNLRARPLSLGLHSVRQR